MNESEYHAGGSLSALIEATALAPVIVEAFRDAGIPSMSFMPVSSPEKNALLMQIYADVINMEIKVSASSQTPALGAAMFGAVAAGWKQVGTPPLLMLLRRWPSQATAASPIPENAAIYDKIYQRVQRPYDYFGRGENDVMKRLRQIRAEAK